MIQKRTVLFIAVVYWAAAGFLNGICAGNPPSSPERLAAEQAFIFEGAPIRVQAAFLPVPAAAQEEVKEPAAFPLQAVEEPKPDPEEPQVIVITWTERLYGGIGRFFRKLFEKLEDHVALILATWPVLVATRVIRFADKWFFNWLRDVIPMAAWAASPAGMIIGAVIVTFALGLLAAWIFSGDDRKPNSETVEEVKKK